MILRWGKEKGRGERSGFRLRKFQDKNRFFFNFNNADV